MHYLVRHLSCRTTSVCALPRACARVRTFGAFYRCLCVCLRNLCIFRPPPPPPPLLLLPRFCDGDATCRDIARGFFFSFFLLFSALRNRGEKKSRRLKLMWKKFRARVTDVLVGGLNFRTVGRKNGAIHLANQSFELSGKTASSRLEKHRVLHTELIFISRALVTRRICREAAAAAAGAAS